MDYESLSDFEVNKAVAGYEYKGARIGRQFNSISAIGVYIEDYSNWIVFDFCNIANDAWPIILANQIDIKHKFEGFEVTHQPIPTALAGLGEDYDYTCSDENILRAAMIVFLKMMEAEDEH